MRLLVAIVFAIGCKEKLPIEVGGVDFDYGFLVTYPRDGVEPIRTSRIFGVDEGRVTFGAQPAFVLKDDEARFVFVALHAEQLHPSFDRARETEMEAILEPPPDVEIAVERASGNLRARTRIPSEAQLLTADLEEASETLRPVADAEFEIFDEVTLRIPVEPEYCRIQGQTPLRPFAASAKLIPGSSFRAVESVYYLDRDRALVATRAYVFLIDRGGTLTSTQVPSVWGIIDDPQWRGFDQIFDLAIGPARPDGSIPLVAVGGDAFHERATYGRIWPLRLDGGSIELERPSSIILPRDVGCTPTPARGCDMRILAATFTPDGRAWVGAADGVILTRSSTATEFQISDALMHRTDIPDGFLEMLPLDLGEHRMVASLKNHIYHLGADGVWRGEYLQRGGILGPEAVRVGAIAAIKTEKDEEIDWWAGGERGQIARKRGDLPWELLSEIDRELVYPPRFAPCGSAEAVGSALEFNDGITAIEAFEDYVHMGFRGCNALVVVRRSDQCVSLVPPEGQDVAFTPESINAIDRFERRLLVGTHGGDLYETVLPEP